MTNKLTCKMSDGTEWEVEYSHPWYTTSGIPQGMCGHLKPIKRKPRDRFVIAEHFDDIGYTTIEGAMDALGDLHPLKRIDAKIIKVREVVE